MQIETHQSSVVQNQPVATATTADQQQSSVVTPVVRITLDTSSNIPSSASNDNNKTVSFAVDQSPMSTSSASLVPQHSQPQKLIASHGTGLSSQGTVLSVGGFLIVGITLITSAVIVLLSQKQSEFEFVAGVFLAVAFPRICRSHTLVCQPLQTVIQPKTAVSTSINRMSFH
ncbi:Rho-type GTPase-activating protein [Trichinella pseudospiralis]